MKRLPLGEEPRPLSENPSVEERIKFDWASLDHRTVALTQQQRTPDWFLHRTGRFTSTTTHTAINVKAAVYFNNDALRELHSDVLSILQLNPTRVVSLANASSMQDDDLPSQLGDINRTEQSVTTSNNASTDKCTPMFWLRGNPSLQSLRDLCDDNGIDHSSLQQKKHMADALAEKFRQKAHEIEQELLTADTSEDDEEKMKLAQVAFLQRMTPPNFMKPFSTKAGGAIEQGIANEDEVIAVLKKNVQKMSGRQYDMRKVREFGLVARLLWLLTVQHLPMVCSLYSS